VQESSTSRVCFIVFLIVSTVLIALGILLISAGGIYIISQGNSAATTTAAQLNIGPYFPTGLLTLHTMFFDIIFLVIPLILTWIILFQSSSYDYVLKVISLIFVVAVTYSLFFQSVAMATFNANSTIFQMCNPIAPATLDPNTAVLCNSGKIVASGVWLTFVGELTLFLILLLIMGEWYGVNSSPRPSGNTNNNNTQQNVERTTERSTVEV